MHWRQMWAIFGMAVLFGCSSGAEGANPSRSDRNEASTNAAESNSAESNSTESTTGTPTTTTPTTTPPTTAKPTTTQPDAFARPAWLGQSTLPLREDGNGAVEPTPPELAPRVLRTPPVFPQPPESEFRFTLGPVPPEVLARSSWVPECPVTVDQLAYVTLSHHGFDGEVHTGELLLNAAVAEDVVGVFRKLFDAEFPIEEMRVVRLEEVDDPPTGDWNDTTSFVCRPAVGSNGWSQHAFGLAVDINPFHNPYLKADLVIPELASYYTDRELRQNGMLYAESVAVQAFAEIGWAWGGNWRTLKDWMHFSQSGG